jgi:multiple sugar transport system permease protein
MEASPTFKVGMKEKRSESRREHAQRRAGLFLASPALMGLLLLMLVPSSAVLILSLTNYQLGSSDAKFVSLANYGSIFRDPIVRRSLANTLRFVLAVVPTSIALALLFSLLIEGRTVFKNFYRTAFFLPVTATLVAMATAWEVLLHPTFGIVNSMLSILGFSKVRFLSDPNVALWTIAAIAVWKQVAFNIVLFLAGLATIRADLYEAAALDGADRGWRRFLLVTWPMLGPVTLFVTVITTIRAFSEFETVAVLTDGGPIHSTTVVLFALYEEAFRYLRIGTGSAIAVVFLVFVATLSLIQSKLSTKGT